MNFVIRKNIFRLLRQIIDPRISTKPCIEYIPSKATMPKDICDDDFFELSNPNDVGVDSNHLCNFEEEIKNTESVVPHTIMVLKNGKCIVKTSFAPYNFNTWHVTYSFCKSLTGLAIGLLYDEGKINLDEKVVDIFKNKISALSYITHRNLTIRHLLTMSSGAVFSEQGSVTESDWIKGYFESGRKFEAGTAFEYNSMNSYVLAAVVNKKSGLSMSDYLNLKLFSHMKIKNYYWEVSPQNIEKGGFGMYMLPCDMAKIGLLYLQEGAWNGKQLVSKEWIKLATSANIDVPTKVSNFDYGYHIWVRKNPHSILLNGMFGQNVIIYPEKNVVVAITSGNSDMFHQNKFFDIADRYFGEYDFDKNVVNIENNIVNVKEKNEDLNYKKEVSYTFWQKLRLKISGMEKENLNHKKIEIERIKKIFSNKYSFNLDKSGGLSVMPLFLQCIQNNYTKGISFLSFEVNENNYICNITESGKIKKIPFNFTKYEFCDLDFENEIYRCGVSSKFTKNEDDNDILILKIYFLETASVRTIKFIFIENEMLIKFYETPGKNFIFKGTDLIINAVKSLKFLEAFSFLTDSEIVMFLVKNTIEPELIGNISE